MALTTVDEQTRNVTHAHPIVWAKGRRLVDGTGRKVTEWSPGENVWRGQDEVAKYAGRPAYKAGWSLYVRKPSALKLMPNSRCIRVAVDDVVASGQDRDVPTIVARRVTISPRCYTATVEAIDDLSGPERLLQAVYGPAKRRSGTKLNGALQRALCIAIELHMEFYPDDIERIYDTQGGQYWLHMEQVYRYAIREGNLSAARSVEACRGRTPFLWQKKRLYVGSQFEWEGMVCDVTSFADFMDGSGWLVACGGYSSDVPYHRKPDERGKRQFKITVQELRVAQKEAPDANA